MKVPAWFDLRKYERCQSFGFAEWYRELENRAIAVAHFRGEIKDANGATLYDYDELVRLTLAAIWEHGTLATSMEVDAHTPLIRPIAVHLTEGGIDHHSFPVRNYSQFDLAFLLFSDLQDPDSTLAEMRRYVEAPIVPDAQRSAMASRLCKPLNEWIEAAEARLGNDGRTEAIVNVDLRASDELLEKAFSAWLSAQRNKLGSRNRRAIPESALAKWHKQRVLPYLDLTLWQLAEGKALPFHRIADALFPDDVDVDLTERVRKVTRRNAESLIDFAFLDRHLRPLAEAELAAGKNW